MKLACPSITSKKSALRSLFSLLLIASFTCSAKNINTLSVTEITGDQRYFEYHQAAYFTHLNWFEMNQEKVSVAIHPIVNYSGIPIEDRDESAAYFNYGKLPQVMNSVYQDAILSTRYFMPVDQANRDKADYQLILVIEQYELPFEHTPDDSWWQKRQGQTQRWLKSPQDAKIKLSLKLLSGQKKINLWSEQVTMTLSSCDINATPQTQTWANNSDQLTQRYLTTAPGQTFLAASNFLIAKAIQRLQQQPILARVSRKWGSEIHLISESAQFTLGESLPLFYQNEQQGKSSVAAGNLKVVNSNQNSAIAYPMDLRADHIKTGDWVEMSNPRQFEMPSSTFSPANKCAAVANSAAR